MNEDMAIMPEMAPDDNRLLFTVVQRLKPSSGGSLEVSIKCREMEAGETVALPETGVALNVTALRALVAFAAEEYKRRRGLDIFDPIVR